MFRKRIYECRTFHRTSLDRCRLQNNQSITLQAWFFDSLCLNYNAVHSIRVRFSLADMNRILNVSWLIEKLGKTKNMQIFIVLLDAVINRILLLIHMMIKVDIYCFVKKCPLFFCCKLVRNLSYLPEKIYLF